MNVWPSRPPAPSGWRRPGWTLASALLLIGCDGPTPPPPPPPPPVTLQLEVGEAAIVAGSAPLSAFTLEGGQGPREYRIAVQSASLAASGNWAMSLDISAAAPAESATATQRAAPAPARTPEDRQGAALSSPLGLTEQHDAAELKLRASARRELLRVGARPARHSLGRVGSGGTDLRARTAQAADPPAIGEEREFTFAVQPGVTVSCTDTAALIQAEAQAVGDQFVIYRDLQAPGWLKAVDYQEILATLEDVIIPVSQAYFGDPADIDNNERVVVLITEETNKLSPAQGLTFIAGFFVPSDLYDSGDPEKNGTTAEGICATSNEAEILYLIAPDPLGDFGRAHTVEFVKQIVQSVGGHELQHLINAEQRLIFSPGDAGDLEDSWLDEGLSHLAEELNGLAAAGHSLRANLTAAELFADPAVFNMFHLANFSRLGQTAGCGGWLRNPENTQTIAAADPGGCSGLRYRGFAWLFLRWLGDQEGASGNGVIPGSNEEALFREIISGGPSRLTGTANVERAVGLLGSGRSWDELLAAFLISPAADDQAEGAPAGTQILTWDLPDVFLGLNEDASNGPNFNVEYPLDIETLSATPVLDQFTVRSSTAKYFSLESSADTPDYEVKLLDTAGLPISPEAAAQLTVIRVR